MVQSVLGGFAIIALAVMAKYAMNRLWQQTLLSTASDALDCADQYGFHVHPLGYGPRIRATGMLNGRRAVVEWRGGIHGEVCWLRVGKRKQQIELIRTGQDWIRALGVEE